MNEQLRSALGAGVQDLSRVAEGTIPSTWRAVLGSVNKRLDTIAATSDDIEVVEAAVRHSNSTSSLLDGLTSKDATPGDWSAWHKETLSWFRAISSPRSAETAGPLGDAAQKALEKLLKESPETNKMLMSANQVGVRLRNFRDYIKVMPTAKNAEEEAFRVLRLPIIPLTDGFVDVKKLVDSPLGVTDLDGKYFVIPNQLVLAISTKYQSARKVVSTTPAQVKRSIKAELEEKLSELEDAVRASAKNANSELRSKFMEQQKKLALSGTRDKLRKKYEAKLNQRVAQIESEYEKLIQAEIQKAVPPKELKTAKARDLWAERIDEDVREKYGPKMSADIREAHKAFDAQIDKRAADEVQDTKFVRSQFVAWVSDYIESESEKLRLEYEDLLAEALDGLKSAKVEEKFADDLVHQAHKKIDALVSVIEKKMGTSITVMPGSAKYKASGYVYYWLATERTLDLLREGGPGAVTVESWGLPF